MMVRTAYLSTIVVLSLGLAGCETSSGGGDPGARPLPAGSSCQSLRAELNKMDAQGAQGKVQAAQSRKVDPATQAVADRYNSLLNSYLGARCHV